MVAFISSLLLTVAMVAPIFWYAKRRPVGTPLTRGEAMLAGVYVFFIIFWIYGVVPHQFLTWADSELNWRPDVVWFGPGGQITLPGPADPARTLFCELKEGVLPLYAGRASRHLQ